MNEEENVRRTSKWHAKLPVRPGPCLVVTLLIVFGLSADMAAAAPVKNLEQKRSPAAVLPKSSSSSSSSYVERSPRSALAVSGRQWPAVREPANCTDNHAVEAAPRQRLNGTPEARPCSASAVHATPERPGNYRGREALHGEEEIGRNATDKSEEDASRSVGPLLFGMRLQAEQGHQASVLTADQHTERWPSAAAQLSPELELRPCEPHTAEARHLCGGTTTGSSSGDAISSHETALPDDTQNRSPAQRRHLPSQEQTQSAGMPGSELPTSRGTELRDPLGSEGVLDTLTSPRNPVSTAAPRVANRASALEDDFSVSDLQAAARQMQAPAGTYGGSADADATHRSDDARLSAPDTSGASAAFIATQQLLGAALDGLAATSSSPAGLDSGAVAQPQPTTGIVLYSAATSPEQQHSPSSVHDHLPPLDNSNVLSGAAATQEARSSVQRTSSARPAGTQSENLAGAAGSPSATTPHVSLTTDHWRTAVVTLSATALLTSSAAAITEPMVTPSVSPRALLSEKTELGSGSEWPAQRLSPQGARSQQQWQQTADIHTTTASTLNTPTGYSADQRHTPSAESSTADAWVRTTRTASNVGMTQRTTVANTGAIGQVDSKTVTDKAGMASESFATPCKNDSQPGGRCLPADAGTEDVPIPAAVIAGAAVGIVVGLAWIVGVPLACVLCCRRSRRRRTEGQERMARYRQHQTEHSYLEELVMLELAKARSRGYVCDSDKVNYDEVFNLNASVANQITTEL